MKRLYFYSLVLGSFLSNCGSSGTQKAVSTLLELKPHLVIKIEEKDAGRVVRQDTLYFVKWSDLDSSKFQFDIEPEKSKKIEIVENYPNPFSPPSHIDISKAHDDTIQFKMVYPKDSTYVESKFFLKPGEYRVYFPYSSKSGVYVFFYENNQKSYSKRFLLL